MCVYNVHLRWKQGYMAEDEGHGQQYVSHYGCDQALKVGGLDLVKRAKSQHSSSR